MIRECVGCGKNFNRLGRELYCEECAFLNKHRRCKKCGRIFVAAEEDEAKDRLFCYNCRPLKNSNGIKANLIDMEVKNAKKAGMTYGKYQKWKFMQQCRMERMINKLNRDL